MLSFNELNGRYGVRLDDDGKELLLTPEKISAERRRGVVKVWNAEKGAHIKCSMRMTCMQHA